MNDDAAEAWAMIERFAWATLHNDRTDLERAITDLSSMLADAVAAYPTQPVALVATLARLNACVTTFDRGAATTRDMMQAHYRSFPKWEGPTKGSR